MQLVAISQLLSCREFTLKFMESLHPVAERIMSCFALGLGYDEDFFREVCDASPTSSCRVGNGVLWSRLLRTYDLDVKVLWHHKHATMTWGDLTGRGNFQRKSR